MSPPLRSPPGPVLGLQPAPHLPRDRARTRACIWLPRIHAVPREHPWGPQHRHKAQTSGHLPPGEPGAESRSTRQALAPVLPTSRGPAVWVEGRRGSFVQMAKWYQTHVVSKLGHRRGTGTAELSPNRTVAHLVPWPLGTPGRVGVGRTQGCSGARRGLVWRAGTRITAASTGSTGGQPPT